MIYLMDSSKQCKAIVVCNPTSVGVVLPTGVNSSKVGSVGIDPSRVFLDGSGTLRNPNVTTISNPVWWKSAPDSNISNLSVDVVALWYPVPIVLWNIYYNWKDETISVGSARTITFYSLGPSQGFRVYSDTIYGTSNTLTTWG